MVAAAVGALGDAGGGKRAAMMVVADMEATAVASIVTVVEVVTESGEIEGRLFSAAAATWSTPTRNAS